MTVVGEAWIRILPDGSVFTPLLTEEVVAGSTKAGAAGGAAAGREFGRSFGSAIKTGLAVAGVGAGIELVKHTVEAAAEHAGAIAVVDRATKNARAENELYGQSIEVLLRKEALLKGFSDEGLYASFTRLVGITHDSAKAFKDVGLAEDVARGRHIEVATAAIALTKAEAGNVTALQRLGIVIPQNITKLKGQERATAALSLVQARFGGESVAFAESSAGATGRLSEGVHILAETFGQGLIPEVTEVSTHLANYLGNQENLVKVEKDVAEGAKIVGQTFQGIVKGFVVAKDVIGPVVNLLGGYGKASELVFGALALRKIQAFALATTGWGAKVITAETGAAGATSAYTAILVANTAALEANAAAQRLSLAGGTATGGFGGGAVGGGIATAEEAASVSRLAVSASGLAGVLKSGVAPAAVLAGYELSTFIRKIPGWDSAFESFGNKATDLALKLSHISSSGISVPTDFGSRFRKNESALADAYQKAISGGGSVSDAFMQNPVAKGFTVHDAEVAWQALGRRVADRTSQLIDQTLRRAAEIASQQVTAGPPGPSVDSAQALRLQRALGTKQTGDEEAIYRERSAFLTKEINRLQATGTLTTKEAKTLAGYYSERTQYESQIQGIEEAAASARQSAAAKAKQLHDQEVAKRKAELQAANQAYRASLSLEEQRLQLQADRAQLTDKNLKDDRKADLALLAFYRREAHDMKLTEAERLQFSSQAIQEQLTIKNLGKGQGAQGATAGQIFAEAASEFRSFGSNIAGRGGILSGQDARAGLAARVLGGSTAQSLTQILARQQAARDREQLTEAQKQTALLRNISKALGGKDGAKAGAEAIRAARQVARVVAG